MNLPIAITGTGAVSPAGWGVASLMSALNAGHPLTPSLLERPRGESVVRTPVLRVPSDPAAMPKFARLRRTSPVSKFAAAAVIEALGPDRLTKISNNRLRVGVVFTLTNGCVNYSNRFFGEVLKDPSVASPILFPETVFNAPSSHLSAMIGSSSPNDTLITDSAGFFSGMDLAAEWIARGEVDGCLVVSSEEIDWLSAEGLNHYSRKYVAAEGAAAIYLELADSFPRILRLPDPISFAKGSRSAAAAECRKILHAENHSRTLLVDGRTGSERFDAPESDAWADWIGPRFSPRKILGEAMGSSAALQVVAAVESLKSGVADHAVITAVGGNQQAGGVLLG
jgi:hypothetical protein